jgi:hypothetical protein
MNKAFISQPMQDREAGEIIKQREEAVEFLKKNGFEAVNSIFEVQYDSTDKTATQKRLHMLSKEIDLMSECTIIYFCDGWEHYRGCRIEHEIAREYNMIIIYENPESAKDNEKYDAVIHNLETLREKTAKIEENLHMTVRLFDIRLKNLEKKQD